MHNIRHDYNTEQNNKQNDARMGKLHFKALFYQRSLDFASTIADVTLRQAQLSPK